MKKRYKIGVILICLTAAVAVFAAEQKRTDQRLVLFKVGGKTVAEMRVLDPGAELSLTGDSVHYDEGTETATLKAGTLRFGGQSGKSITVQADELVVLPLQK